MPRGYETFEHTADIGIRAWAGELTGLFEEAGKALFSVIAELDNVVPAQKISVELQAESEEELFLKWLKELLFIFDTERFLLSRFKVDEARKRLRAQASGELLNPFKHRLFREVKAITRHQFKLIREPSRFLAEVILDI
jgi:SHS2 domain-containing protein